MSESIGKDLNKLPVIARSETDEAISYLCGEIATLPLVARNDNVIAFNAFVLVTHSTVARLVSSSVIRLRLTINESRFELPNLNRLTQPLH
jgi:hypothetical protein